ncbi:SGNH/GDSL hydrolase family protein [Pedobacter sp. HMF7647]|uniref:SGNH/GDSL hydrolase family protein n=1 Tax=Hufsiella arboris TaxID=2695275 RepID=A0A7K1Y5Z8_9SPHI|nr:SGNH/GDSL hydrolase family protein [Hufsiella arboris]MXV49448.1 SGNH/GDSL hydrolase family protein [Hufsiella arboris]
MKVALACFIVLNLFCRCSKKSNDPVLTRPLSHKPDTAITAKQISYLALGDSYTFGQSVQQSESFPFQLSAKLKNHNVEVVDLQVIARSGWTTGELQQVINTNKPAKTFDIVTLLIGVNNQYRGYSKDTYRKEFARLLKQAVEFAGGKKNRVFVLSIPDWGVTPFGGSGTNKLISAEIDAFNQINRAESEKESVTYIDITAGSRSALNDASLVASDGLHPSAKMYSYWADALYNAILNVI